jgi:CheY-like chemotaxis protein
MLCDDLIFTSKVTSTAKALGASVQPVRTPTALVDLARKDAPVCIIIDLHLPGLDLPTLMQQLAQACPTMPRVVAYGSHVEADTLRAAREAGCEPVWPRSKFVEELPVAMAEWLRASAAP